MTSSGHRGHHGVMELIRVRVRVRGLKVEWFSNASLKWAENLAKV